MATSGAAMEPWTSSFRLKLSNGTQRGRRMSTNMSVSWPGKHGPGWVVLLGEQPPRLSVPDPGHVTAEQRRGAQMVGVVVGVDDVGHLVRHAVGRGDLVDGA